MAGLAGVWLVGCASPARVYDDARVAMIRKGATTEPELLAWFGPATQRTMGPDGSKALSWRFAPAKFGRAESAGKLEVRLGSDGRVTAYTGMAGNR
jgi:hypothetical protein